MKNISKVFVTLVTCMFLFGCSRTSIEDVGGKGEACFPNHTCNQPHTCFQVAEDELCYLEIKPVVPGYAKVCYTFVPMNEKVPGAEAGLQIEQTKCFDTPDECLQNFATSVLATNALTIKGCGN